jgi:hypothetical protein
MSVMPFRRALLSAVTLFGGHFLNRRLDRVVLIGTLLALAGMASIGVPFALAALNEPNDALFKWILRLPLILVGTVALVSAGLTFGDARQPSADPPAPTIRITRTPLSLFGVVVMAAVFVVAGASFRIDAGLQTGPVRPTVGHVYFGSGAVVENGQFLPAPPRGPERLRGRIKLDGAGVEGVGLFLKLNSEYSARLDSDSQGEFEVALPAGPWRINEIVASDWEGRPKDRDLILFSGHERVKDEEQYSRFNYRLAEGLEVSLPAASNVMPIEIEFRDALSMIWPPRRSSSGDRAWQEIVPDAEISTAAIAWRPVEGATEYEVQISHIGRESTIPYAAHLLTRRLSGSTLPLASLPQRPASDMEDEYSVHIFAFDAEGSLLTESSVESDDTRFKLTGAARLGKERQYVGRGLGPQVISEEFEANDQKLQLASKLLDQKRFDDARRVLDNVTKDAPRSTASALRGRLAALQGDCKTAIRLFDQADSESEPDCVFMEDRKLCEATQK